MKVLASSDFPTLSGQFLARPQHRGDRLSSETPSRVHPPLTLTTPEGLTGESLDSSDSCAFGRWSASYTFCVEPSSHVAVVAGFATGYGSPVQSRRKLTVPATASATADAARIFRRHPCRLCPCVMHSIVLRAQRST